MMSCRRMFVRVGMTLALLLLVFGVVSCGDQATTELDEVESLTADVVPDKEAPLATYCGTVTCPYFVNFTNCSNRSYNHIFQCNNRCGTPKWSGCQKYNSSTCTGTGYGSGAPYCSTQYTLACKYWCYRY